MTSLCELVVQGHKVVESFRCCAGVSYPSARAGLDVNIFCYVARGTSKQYTELQL